MSEDFTRGWHDGYRAARADLMRVLGYGPAGRDIISRAFDWADGHPPKDVVMSEPPTSDVR